MHEKITDIQNSFWHAYKKFSQTGDMKQYNSDVQRIIQKYSNDNPMREFCEDLTLSWAKIINELKRWML